MTKNRGGSRRTWVRSMLAVASGLSAVLTMAATADAATQSAGTAAAASCPYQYFCAYPEPNFGGTPILMYNCREYDIPWSGLGSWINNQTPGTRAQFRSSDHVTRWTDDGAYDSDASAPWGWVWWVKPC